MSPSTSSSVAKYDWMAVQLDEMCIASVDAVKLLGAVLDFHLNMNAQVNNVLGTCDYHLHQTGKLRNNRKHVKRLYSH